ncbi:MAG: decaprenyl-phosphate phosphoribosyltransferase [Patescibacteria group bacterium]|nr:MAG: decaprenyl-phosphate phosphoribosyltransferase [Patescibacteria group bacterium]
MLTKFKNTTLYYALKTARPRQWIKNIALYAALVFSGFFFYDPVDAPSYFTTVTYAFLIFCILTSSIYFINDIVDYEADKQHPFKKKRPIASGKLSIKFATWIAVLGLIIVAIFSYQLSLFFQILTFAYLALQILYSKKLKHIPILDVASIATGFLIRIYAGAVVVNLHMSVWFLLTVISASLFLAVGKRQSERTLLLGKSGASSHDFELATSQTIGATRITLKRYSQRLLDQYTSMFANATWLTYAIFAFQNEIDAPRSKVASLYTFLPKALHTQKLLMITTPLVIFGVMRYLQLVYESNQGESPEKVLLKDKPLLFTVFLFGALVMIITYVLT